MFLPGTIALFGLHFIVKISLVLVGNPIFGFPGFLGSGNPFFRIFQNDFVDFFVRMISVDLIFKAQGTDF